MAGKSATQQAIKVAAGGFPVAVGCHRANELTHSACGSLSFTANQLTNLLKQRDAIWFGYIIGKTPRSIPVIGARQGELHRESASEIPEAVNEVPFVKISLPRVTNGFDPVCNVHPAPSADVRAALISTEAARQQ